MNYREWRRRLVAMRLLRAFHYTIWMLFNLWILVTFIRILQGNQFDSIVGIFCTFWAIVLWLQVQQDTKDIKIWLTFEPE